MKTRIRKTRKRHTLTKEDDSEKNDVHAFTHSCTSGHLVESKKQPSEKRETNKEILKREKQEINKKERKSSEKNRKARGDKRRRAKTRRVLRKEGRKKFGKTDETKE